MGFIVSAIAAAIKMGKATVTKEEKDGVLTYIVEGQVFFASVDTLVTQFDYKTSAKKVIIDCTRARLWDESVATALVKGVNKFKENGIEVKFVGMDVKSKAMLEKLYGDKGLVM